MSKHISCVPTGVHLGSRRFPDRDDRPKVKRWRCELTALSKLYNIYFLACIDTIHIYQPSFPDQNLSGEPALILHLPVSPVTGPGIDPDDPHSITRILVDYLGHEEILLATCDDGDVVGYRVDEIQRALERGCTSSSGELEAANEKHVKWFLHRNVGASAWGLAVHREARIIAISANTHKVTVLAYALADLATGLDDSLDSDDPNADNFTCSQVKLIHDFPFPRRKDHIITLLAWTNVPSVSFNNNGENPSGRWLFSNSIDGKTIVWDIHNPRAPARIIQLGWCASVKDPTREPGFGPGRCACPNRVNYPHGSWGAMVLDTQSAYEMSNIDELILEPLDIAPCFKDITDCKKSFTVNSYNPYHNPDESNTYESTSDDDDGSSDMVMPEPDEETEESTSSSEIDHMQDISVEMDADSDSDAMSIDNEEDHNLNGEEWALDGQGNEGHDDSTQAPVASSDTGVQTDSLFVPETPAIVAEILSQSQPEPATPLHATTTLPWYQPMADNLVDMIQSDDDFSDEDDEDELSILSIAQGQIAIVNAMRMPSRWPYCEVTTVPTHLSFANDIPPSGPCLILTKEEMYLVQRPFATTVESIGPVVSMRRPLHPGPWASYLTSYDRLCFFAQIPELGVFVIGTPLGRAGVFSLYWTRRKDVATPQYGFKLEYLLPFKQRNEREVYVPYNDEARLMGLAVGPVQGMFDTTVDNTDQIAGQETAPQPRRWRLIMYYTDHTVLNFELSKRRTDESPGLGDLVV